MKVTSLNIRTTQELRDLVDASARARGWSMAAEAAHRILQTYRDDAVMRAIGVLQRRISDLAVRLGPSDKEVKRPPQQPTSAADDSPRVRILPDGRMTRADAARYLGHTSKTLAMWQLQGKGPESIKMGGRRFYYKAALDAFIQGA